MRPSESEPAPRRAAFVHAPVLLFRAHRTYVHSTDLYPELMVGAARAGWGPIEGPVDIRFRRRISTQPEFHFGGESDSEAVEEEQRAAVEFELGAGAQVRRGRIVASARVVTGRKPYDERPIWDRAKLTPRRVELLGDSGMAPIEVITALGLLLHRTELPPPEGLRWLLSRLALLRPLRPGDAHGVIEIMDQVIGRTMTRLSLTTSEGRLGTMSFILARD